MSESIGYQFPGQESGPGDRVMGNPWKSSTTEFSPLPALPSPISEGFGSGRRRDRSPHEATAKRREAVMARVNAFRDLNCMAETLLGSPGHAAIWQISESMQLFFLMRKDDSRQSCGKRQLTWRVWLFPCLLSIADKKNFAQID